MIPLKTKVAARQSTPATATILFATKMKTSQSPAAKVTIISGIAAIVIMMNIKILP